MIFLWSGVPLGPVGASGKTWPRQNPEFFQPRTTRNTRKKAKDEIGRGGGFVTNWRRDTNSEGRRYELDAGQTRHRSFSLPSRPPVQNPIVLFNPRVECSRILTEANKVNEVEISLSVRGLWSVVPRSAVSVFSMSARQHFSFKMFLHGKKGLNAFLPGASLTPGSVGVGTIRASAFMHFLGTEVQGRQLVFLPGLRSGEHSWPDYGRGGRTKAVQGGTLINDPAVVE